jgi:hypothetical protein
MSLYCYRNGKECGTDTYDINHGPCKCGSCKVYYDILDILKNIDNLTRADVYDILNKHTVFTKDS